MIKFLDLNQLNVREPRKRLLIENCTDVNNYNVKCVTDLADHVLSVGPRYQIEDIRFNIASHLGPRTSGVLRKTLKKLSTRRTI